MGWSGAALPAFENPVRVQKIRALSLPLKSTLILPVCSMRLLPIRGGNITISVSRDEIAWLTVVALGGTKADIANGTRSCIFVWLISKSIYVENISTAWANALRGKIKSLYFSISATAPECSF